MNALRPLIAAYLLVACLVRPEAAGEVLAVGLPTLVLLPWLLTRHARRVAAQLDADRRATLAVVKRRVELERQLREELEKRCPSARSPERSSTTPPPRVRRTW